MASIKKTMAVEILRPQTWVRFHPSLCADCKAGCCTLPLRVSSEDLYQMGFVRYDEVNGPLKRIANRLIKQGIVRSYNARTKLFTIQRRKTHDCIFLNEDRRCTIYDKRPFVCRSFPNNSVRSGFCPYQKKCARD